MGGGLDRELLEPSHMRRFLGWIFVLAGCGGVPEEHTVTDDLLASGRFVTTPDGASLGYDIRGTTLIESAADGTRVSVRIRSGLGEEGTEYPVHVHDGACADGGGGHYLVDPTLAAGPDNEIWPTVIAGRRSNGRGEAIIAQGLRPDARSVVIHDPATRAKIACADIRLNGAIGEFSALPDGEALGVYITGIAATVLGGRTTHTWVIVTGGLAPSAEYPVHMHDATCAEGGGGHYLLDPNAPPGIENEIWPTLLANRRGQAFSFVRTDVALRLDAQSIVIHDPATRVKIACADLD
jgi:hypothetical protein